uniref:Kinesin motor domain-containing protein n=1 Tax=Caenorhabditis tropicalis TaxID=1561998 RepID=A0A1I7UQA7_9PELO
MVTGSAGGKNAALRRTMEIIAEQNEEYERQQRYAMSKHVVATGGHEGITTTGELLLNVARFGNPVKISNILLLIGYQWHHHKPHHQPSLHRYSFNREVQVHHQCLELR